MELVFRHEQLVWREQRPRAIAAQQPVPRVGVFPEAPERPRHVAVQADQRLEGQVLGQRRGGIEKQRQVILDAGRHDAVRHVLVQRRLRRVAFEDFAEASAKAGASGLVLRKLARWKQPHPRHRIDGALAVDIERADRFDLVVEQVDAVGQGASHRKQVDQPAAYAEFAGRNDLRDMLIAGQRELRAQAIDIERFALLDEKRESREIGRRREAVKRSRRRDDHHIAIAARHAVERRQSLRHQILMRRKMIVGQRLPVGQDGDLQRRSEPRDLGSQPLRGKRIGADDGQQLPALRGIGRRLRKRQRVGRAGERLRDGLPPGRRHGGQEAGKGDERLLAGRRRRGQRNRQCGCSGSKDQLYGPRNAASDATAASQCATRPY